MSGPDACKALYLPPDASAEDVKRAYRELAKLLHPDRGGDATRFRQLQEVYETALFYMEARHAHAEVADAPTYSEPQPRSEPHVSATSATGSRSDMRPPGIVPVAPMGAPEKLLLGFLIGVPAFGVFAWAVSLPGPAVMFGVMALLACFVGSIITGRSAERQKSSRR